MQATCRHLMRIPTILPLLWLTPGLIMIPSPFVVRSLQTITQRCPSPLMLHCKLLTVVLRLPRPYTLIHSHPVSLHPLASRHRGQNRGFTRVHAIAAMLHWSCPKCMPARQPHQRNLSSFIPCPHYQVTTASFNIYRIVGATSPLQCA